MRILSISAFIVLLDQATKVMVKGISIPAIGLDHPGLVLGSSRPIIGDVLRLTYIENPGMAFGIDIGGKLFFSVFSILASIGILVYLHMARNENLAFRIALAMILGGAVGNLIDRVFYGAFYGEGPLFYGKVVDFIDADFFDLNLFGYHLTRWPVFNIADASVTSGVLLMLLSHRSQSKSEETTVAAGTSTGSPGNMVPAPIAGQDSPSASSEGDSPPS